MENTERTPKMKLLQKSASQSLSADELDALLLERLACMQSLLPCKPLTQVATDMYLSELTLIHGEVGLPVLDQAITECIRECNFLPTIAQIRERAGLNKTKTEHSQANQAWLVMWEWMRKYWGYTGGTYAGMDENNEPIIKYPPKLPERIQYSARIAGGMKAINETKPEDVHFRRDDFIQAYEAFDYAERFPLQLPEELRDLLPSVAAPKSLPSRREVKAVLENVADATQDEALAAIGRRMRETKVREESKPQLKQYNFGPPKTDEQIAEEKRKAREIAEKYKTKDEAESQ